MQNNVPKMFANLGADMALFGMPVKHTNLPITSNTAGRSLTYELPLLPPGRLKKKTPVCITHVAEQPKG